MIGFKKPIYWVMVKERDNALISTQPYKFSL